MQPLGQLWRPAFTGTLRFMFDPQTPTADEVVSVQDLRVTYGDTVAVDNVSFAVRRGEIFGILGPNGAGKTTTVECIGGLRHPDSSHISVLGSAPLQDRHALREQVAMIRA